MKKMELSKYMYDTVAAGTNNQLPISSVCNANCIFCSNDMNPFKIYREGFREIEDVRKGIALLDSNAPEIRISDSLPGRISEGEALLHPKLLQILELIRKKCRSSVIQITTNGSTLTQEFIDTLKPFAPLKFMISYHSNTEKHWCDIFNLKPEKFKIATDAFQLIKEAGFQLESTIVPMPNMIGYDDIEKSVKFLSNFTRYVTIYAPGFSRFVPDDLKKKMDTDYKELSYFFTKMRKAHNMNLDFISDPLKPLLFTPHQYMINTYNNNFRNPLWLFSEAAYGRGSKIIQSYQDSVPNNHYFAPVKNETYGGNINVAGLLMVDDFDKAIEKTVKEAKKKKIEIDLLILPTIAFDRFGEDLTCKNYSELYDKYKIHIWLY